MIRPKKAVKKGVVAPTACTRPEHEPDRIHNAIKSSNSCDEGSKLLQIDAS